LITFISDSASSDSSGIQEPSIAIHILHELPCPYFNAIQGQALSWEETGYLDRILETRMVRSTLRFFNEISSITLVVAAQTIANIVKSSLGPLGLDKMLVDNIGVRCMSSPWVPITLNACGYTGSHDFK
jgi:hypothetical protein